jgi:hypothetical protein
MKTCGPQFFFIGNIAGNKIGNAAAAIGNEIVLVNDRHLGIWKQTLDTAGSLWSGCNAAYYNNFLTHYFHILIFIIEEGYYLLRERFRFENSFSDNYTEREKYKESLLMSNDSILLGRQAAKAFPPCVRQDREIYMRKEDFQVKYKLLQAPAG